MRHRFLFWRDKLLFFSLLALFNTGSTYVRVLIRGLLEGQAFQWSYYSGLKPDGRPALTSGEGLFGDTDHLLLSAFAVIWLICAGSRQPDRFFQAAFAGWTSIQLGTAVWLTLTFGAELTVSKETLGLINVPLAWFSLPPLAVTWLLSVALLVRGLLPGRSYSVAAWTGLNTALLVAAAGFLSASAAVLNLGPQHGPTDLLGIGFIYMGLIAAFLGVSSWGRREGGDGGATPDRSSRH